MNEGFKLENELPKEVLIDMDAELKTNSEGKHYEYEKNRVYYGGDYLSETPNEIDLDLPPSPKEENSIF
jgi:hypothetical protein